MTDLKHKAALVVGIANDHSIAAGCARAFRGAGAEVAITYVDKAAKPYVAPAAEVDGATSIVMDGRTALHCASSGGGALIGAIAATALQARSTRTGGAACLRQTTTSTSTDMPSSASAGPMKLPATGAARRMSRTTATGMRFRPPTLRLVESNVIQPAPGT